MSYQVEFKVEALSGLEKIGQTDQKRILRKIRWFADNFEQLSPPYLIHSYFS